MYRLDGQFCIKFSVVDCFFIYTMIGNTKFILNFMLLKLFLSIYVKWSTTMYVFNLNWPSKQYEFELYVALKCLCLLPEMKSSKKIATSQRLTNVLWIDSSHYSALE